MVGHRVVKLPGDPRPLVLDRAAALLLPLRFEEANVLLSRLCVEPADPSRIPNEPGDHEEDLGLDDLLQSVREACLPEDECRQRDAEADEDADRQPPLELLAGRVERDQRAKTRAQLGTCREDRKLDEQRAEDHEDDGQRPASPKDQRQRLEHEQDEIGDAGRADVRCPGEDAHERDGRDDDGDRPVEQVGVRRDRWPGGCCGSHRAEPYSRAVRAASVRRMSRDRYAGIGAS